MVISVEWTCRGKCRWSSSDINLGTYPKRNTNISWRVKHWLFKVGEWSPENFIWKLAFELNALLEGEGRELFGLNMQTHCCGPLSLWYSLTSRLRIHLIYYIRFWLENWLKDYRQASSGGSLITVCVSLQATLQSTALWCCINYAPWKERNVSTVIYCSLISFTE